MDMFVDHANLSRYNFGQRVTTQVLPPGECKDTNCIWIRDVCILTMVLNAGMYVYHSCLFSRTLQTGTFEMMRNVSTSQSYLPLVKLSIVLKRSYSYLHAIHFLECKLVTHEKSPHAMAYLIGGQEHRFE